MKTADPAFELRLADERLLSSDQPLWVPFEVSHRLSPPLGPQLFRAISSRDTSGVLLGDHRYFPAFAPLPNPVREPGKDHRMFSRARN
jgi:hypothetical protein